MCVRGIFCDCASVVQADHVAVLVDDDTGRKVAGAGSILFAIFLARKLLTMGSA